MAITFHTEDSTFKLPQKRKTAVWIRHCIENEGLKTGDISFIFCSSARHLEINRQYLGHDYNTDVITFDYGDLAKKIISGDIFIDPDTVTANSTNYGTASDEEMRRVMIHGVLHLCGYRDKTEAEQGQMRSREDSYLKIF